MIDCLNCFLILKFLGQFSLVTLIHLGTFIALHLSFLQTVMDRQDMCGLSNIQPYQCNRQILQSTSHLMNNHLGMCQWHGHGHFQVTLHLSYCQNQVFIIIISNSWQSWNKNSLISWCLCYSRSQSQILEGQLCKSLWFLSTFFRIVLRSPWKFFFILSWGLTRVAAYTLIAVINCCELRCIWSAFLQSQKTSGNSVIHCTCTPAS